MSVHEEVEEHIHHAQNRFDRLVAANMAIVAALLAVVSVLGQHYNTEQLLKQQETSDQWAYYQAKDIRHYVAQTTKELLIQLKAGTDTTSRYESDADRFNRQKAAIQEEARNLERERDRDGKRAHSFHFGEIFLEAAIVFLSLAILTKRKQLAWVAFASALVGIGWATGAFLR